MCSTAELTKALQNSGFTRIRAAPRDASTQCAAGSPLASSWGPWSRGSLPHRKHRASLLSGLAQPCRCSPSALRDAHHRHPSPARKRDALQAPEISAESLGSTKGLVMKPTRQLDLTCGSPWKRRSPVPPSQISSSKTPHFSLQKIFTLHRIMKKSLTQCLRGIRMSLSYPAQPCSQLFYYCVIGVLQTRVLPFF